MFLDTTFRTLAQSVLPQVPDVLAQGIALGDQVTRQRCIQTLARRQCRRSHELLISHWPQYHSVIFDSLKEDIGNFAVSLVQLIEEELAAGSSTPLRAATEQRVSILTSIVTRLSIRSAMSPLIDAAWKHPSRVVRGVSVDAVLAMAQPWGEQARGRDPEQPRDPATEPLRLELVSQLLRCASHFQKHRSEELLDAFLVLSTWNDPALHAALSEENPCGTLLLGRLRDSERQPIRELLAGFLRRRNVPECVLSGMLQRPDREYRETLLQVISAEPSPDTIDNLKRFGLPDCLRGGVTLLRTREPNRDAAIAHAYSSAMQEAPETLSVLIEILDRQQATKNGNELNRDAVAVALMRCHIPSFESWLHAFDSRVIDGGESHGSSQDLAAAVCLRLIELTLDTDTRFSRLSHRLLSEINIQNALPGFSQLRPEQKQRLGRVLLQIDSTTLDVVRDAIRHAVMQHRLEAIEFTQTLGLVEMMIQPFTFIVDSDHQSARLAAAKALGTGHSEDSEKLLHKLAASPLGSLREAATQSLSQREMMV